LVLKVNDTSNNDPLVKKSKTDIARD